MANIKATLLKIKEEWARFLLSDFVKLAPLSFCGPKVRFFALIIV